LFQPTRPVRGATLATHGRHQDQDPFQPTRPVRGATILGVDADGVAGDVSTHAPRAGRDTRKAAALTDQLSFQPTRPVRGATLFAFVSFPDLVLFQPTRPVRGATGGSHQLRGVDVSTHAPRAGRDLAQTASSAGLPGFNPRAPCGARPAPCPTWSKGCAPFQPTRPVRGATAGSRGCRWC